MDNSPSVVIYYFISSSLFTEFLKLMVLIAINLKYISTIGLQTNTNLTRGGFFL